MLNCVELMSVPSDKLKLMIQSYSTPKKKHPHIFSTPNNVSKNKQSVQFKDNRPDATTQLKVQQIANQPIQRQENKTGMPDNLKSGIENLSGMDMSDVKVHYNSSQPAQLQAHAFAQGNQIHIASGQEKHLPHEAWHVVQQKQGRVTPTKQLKGKVNINDDARLEKEADVMGDKSNTIQKKAFHTYTISNKYSSTLTHQLVKRNPGDLDYGFSADRHVAMQDAVSKGDEARSTALTTVDGLNSSSGVTDFMNRFKFHELIAKIRGYNESTNESLLGADLGTRGRGYHTLEWIKFLKKNIDRIDLSKQVSSALGPRPTEATKDRLNKNRDKGVAPDRTVLRAWYVSNTIPSDSAVEDNLSGWVWNAFFRITSKLGIEFTASLGKAIHFNITANAYQDALARRSPLVHHGREAITYSELRHLKRLQDRGKAPTVHFQDNAGGVHDVASPFKTLDMLNANGIKKLLQTPQWTIAAVKYEERLGVYAANNRADARTAVKESLTKMDSVFNLKNRSRTLGDFHSHREVFGQKNDTSAGQVGDNPDTVRSVIKGEALPGHDEVNMRERMTAVYNAGLWHPRRSSISSVLARIGSIKDAVARKEAAERLGISEDNINDVYATIQSQLQDTKSKIIAIANLRPARESDRQTAAEKSLGIDARKSLELVTKIADIHAIVRERTGKSGVELAALNERIDALLNELSDKFTKVNILATIIDNDASRTQTSRILRGHADKLAHQKSAKDYEEMGVPLSSREKASITGGVTDPLAKLPWEEGLAVFSINGGSGWGKQMKDAGIPTVAGNSGTAARLLKIYKWLGLTNVLPFRLGIMGWMLPSRDHSLYEIMYGAKSVGVAGTGEDLTNPIKMYQKIDPVSKGELLSNAGEGDKFPEGVALEKVSDATYEDLIKQS